MKPLMLSRRGLITGAAALAALLLGALGTAEGQTARKLLVPLSGSSKTLVPSATLNFSAGTYAGGCSSASACLTVTRASTVATDLTYTAAAGASYTTYAANTPRIKAGWGLLAEDNRTNYLLNSTAPATQTTGTLPNGAAWLWVNGTGSATLSNGTATGCTGTAQQGQFVSFTTAGAGTCVVTVAGSLNEFQLEYGATGPTSFIATTSSPAARGTEIYTATGSLATALGGASGYSVVSFSGLTNVNQGLINRNNGVTDLIALVGSTNTAGVYVAGTPTAATASIVNTAFFNGSASTIFAQSKLGTSWGSGGVSVVFNDGAVVSTSSKFNSSAPNLNIGSYQGGVASANYFISSISVGTYTPTNAIFKSATNAWSSVLVRDIGDSLTFGFNSTYAYPLQLGALLPGQNQANPNVNLGITGETAATMVANWATATAPIHDPTIPKCVDLIWAGTNDLVGGGTPASVFSSLQSLWTLSHGQGCKVVAYTILPRTGGLSGTAQAFETARQSLNTLIRNASSQYDALVDVGNDPNIGVATEFTATVTGTSMVVSAVATGTIQYGSAGNLIYGPNVGAGTVYVSGFVSGTPGGVGTYTLSASDTALSGDVIQAPNQNCYNTDGTHLTGYPAALPAVCGSYLTGGDAAVAADAYAATGGILH
jgi:hypothetical protein